MGYKVVKNLTVRNKGNKGGNRPQWLVVHYVGATGQAYANSRYFKTVYRGSSAHYFIDEGNIVQVVEDDTPAWHVGDGSRTKRGQFNGYVGYGAHNNNSIGIELCLDTSTGIKVQDMDFHEGTLKRAEWLIKEKQRVYKIPNNRVIRHYDVSGKNCPGNWSHNNWSKWWGFKERLEGKKEGRPQEKQDKSIEKKARDTIAGKYGNGADRVKGLGADYNKVMKRVNEIMGGNKTPNKPVKKSTSDVAKEVIKGLWGNNPSRSEKLKRAGYSPNTIQNEVNKILSKKGSTKLEKKSVTDIAKEVIKGEWGNGKQRADKLKRSGYNPETVQREVNKQLGGAVSNKKVINQRLVDDVIKGKYGNGKDREARLKRAGYDPKEVQKAVNKRLR